MIKRLACRFFIGRNLVSPDCAGGFRCCPRRKRNPLALALNNVKNQPTTLRPRKKPATPSRAARAETSLASKGAEVASRRKLYVFATLIAVMLLTSALLWAVQMSPLSPDAARSLSATDQADDMNQVFDTRQAVASTRWKYIFIHHSQTTSGSAETLASDAADPKGMADHFVIGNGDGCKDGAVQYGDRWNEQYPAGKAPDVDRMNPNCISICLIGDFDRSFPTPTQMKSLGQLVDVLQRRLHIDREHVLMVDAKGSAAGSGRYFPRAAFRDQLLP